MDVEEIGPGLIQEQEKIYRLNHLRTVRTTFQLGHVLRFRGKYNEAGNLYRQSLKDSRIYVA